MQHERFNLRIALESDVRQGQEIKLRMFECRSKSKIIREEMVKSKLPSISPVTFPSLHARIPVREVEGHQCTAGRSNVYSLMRDNGTTYNRRSLSTHLQDAVSWQKGYWIAQRSVGGLK